MSKKLTIEFLMLKSKTDRLSSIRNLNLWGCDLSDISIISELSNLEVLCLTVNLISDLQPLSSLRNLTELYLRKNNVSDPSQLFALSKLPKLRSLILAENPISQIPIYRALVVKLVPSLYKLDDAAVSPEDKKAADELDLDRLFVDEDHQEDHRNNHRESRKEEHRESRKEDHRESRKEDHREIHKENQRDIYRENQRDIYRDNQRENQRDMYKNNRRDDQYEDHREDLYEDHYEERTPRPQTHRSKATNGKYSEYNERTTSPGISTEVATIENKNKVSAILLLLGDLKRDQVKVLMEEAIRLQKTRDHR